MRCHDEVPPDGPSITFAILAAFGIPLAGLLAGALGGKSFLSHAWSEDAGAVVGAAAGLVVGLVVGWIVHRLVQRPEAPALAAERDASPGPSDAPSRSEETR